MIAAQGVLPFFVPTSTWTKIALIVLLLKNQEAFGRRQGNEGDLPVWSPDLRPRSMPEIAALDVMCYTDKMTVTVKFSSPFSGMIFSKGSYGQQNCNYVASNSGRTDYKFDIVYDQCGTKPDLQGKFYENTIVIQYEKDLIELWDEAKRLRCEWANDYRQLTESMPAVKMDDLTVIELNFQGDNVDCWMEIQEGKGPWASHVSGIVPIGSTLTLVVAINDPSGEFDMMVRSCVAHDGVKPPLQLTDERGCVLRPKMFSVFQKTRTKDGRASVITYAHFSAFKFPDTMQVNIQCKVVICRHGCPKPCSSDTFEGMGFPHRIGLAPLPEGRNPPPATAANPQDSGQHPEGAATDQGPVSKAAYAERKGDETSGLKDQPHTQSYFPSHQDISEASDHRPGASGSFPYGPRSYGGNDSGGGNRFRKSRGVHDDQELRVSNSYLAISRTDLAFAPNVTADSVSVYAGRRSDSGDYGVCLSVPSFGALFASLGMFAVTAVLVAVVCGYHYRKNAAGKGCPPAPATLVQQLNGQRGGGQEHEPGRTVMQMNTLSRTKVQ